jgi:hypothetical protein
VSRLALILLAALACLALVACGSSPTPTETETVTAPATEPGESTPSDAGTTPAEDGAPTAALKRLLSAVTDPHGEYQSKDFLTDEYVTQHFIDAYDEASADLGYLDYDPFICAQQIPMKIDYVKESIDGADARVTATLEYGGDERQLQVYDMVDADGAWKLDRSECLG